MKRILVIRRSRNGPEPSACNRRSRTVTFTRARSRPTRPGTHPRGVPAGRAARHAQTVCLTATPPTSPVNCPAGATDYGFGAGSTAPLATIPHAFWIWAPGITGATSPSELAQYFFSKRVRVHGRPVFGRISVAADDFAEVSVNGTVVGTIGSTTTGATRPSREHPDDVRDHGAPGPREELDHRPGSERHRRVLGMRAVPLPAAAGGCRLRRQDPSQERRRLTDASPHVNRKSTHDPSSATSTMTPRSRSAE